MITAFKIGFVCFRIDEVHIGEMRLLLRREFDLDLTCNGLGHF